MNYRDTIEQLLSNNNTDNAYSRLVELVNDFTHLYVEICEDDEEIEVEVLTLQENDLIGRYVFDKQGKYLYEN